MAWYGLSVMVLVVISDLSNFEIRYVTNPLTKQLAILPPYTTRTGHYSDCGLAFVEASMVRACRYGYIVPKTQIALLTIGVDKDWRHIDIKHLLLQTERGFIGLPLVSGGYVHWTSKDFVLTLNVETEIVRWFPVLQLPNIDCVIAVRSWYWLN